MYVPGYTVLTSQAACSKHLGSLKARNLLSRDVTALTSQERFCTRSYVWIFFDKAKAETTLISSFRRVLNVMRNLLGCSSAYGV
jgi:hypothetical protein